MNVRNHSEANLSSEESIEQIANFFAQISQEYSPLNCELLPNRVKVKLNSTSAEQNIVPVLKEQDVSEQISKSKKTNSMVPGDLPKPIVQEFPEELAEPVTKIFQQILDTKKWPAMWRTEYGVPLQKKANPENENQLRIISLTSFFSKTLENLVIKWLLEFIGDKMDPKQFGGQKGNSITHYLIEFVNFILYNQDMTNPNAVLALMVDFSKAFNRQDHNTLITILSDMGCPRWLLEIVIAFLSERELIVKYKGLNSERKSLPGGSPQGTRLGMFLFLVLINFAGLPAGDLDVNIGETITNKRRKPMGTTHMKYIDDLSFASALNLKDNLVVDHDLPMPLSYHERTNHTLPREKNPIQHQFDDLKSFANDHQMVINEDKTKVMLFNQGRKYDFLPHIETESGDMLEVVEEVKLLGLVVRSDLSWRSNTENLCKKAYQRLWMLRNLKKFGANTAELLDVYNKQCRSVLELAVPAWAPGINGTEVKQLERVQKTAFAIILGDGYRSYKHALQKLEVKTLESRRKDICLTFGKKALKSDQFSKWFCLNDKTEPVINTRYSETKTVEKLKPVITRTRRYMRSPIPYLTNLLNQDFEDKSKTSC